MFQSTSYLTNNTSNNNNNSNNNSNTFSITTSNSNFSSNSSICNNSNNSNSNNNRILSNANEINKHLQALNNKDCSSIFQFNTNHNDNEVIIIKETTTPATKTSSTITTTLASSTTTNQRSNIHTNIQDSMLSEELHRNSFRMHDTTHCSTPTLTIQSSSSSLELNKALTSNLTLRSLHDKIRTKSASVNESLADKAFEKYFEIIDIPSSESIDCTNESNHSTSPSVSTTHSIQSNNTNLAYRCVNELKRRNPSENKNGGFEFKPLNYDVTNLKFNEAGISTKFIVKKVKEILTDNEINQKIFGKALLNAAESTISLLMSKPKNWKALSRRGREPYCKMYLWLKDPNGLKKLTTWIQNYKRYLKLSQNKVMKIDDNEEINEINEFTSPRGSPILSDITKTDDSLSSLNTIQFQKASIHTPPLQHQHLTSPQPISQTLSSPSPSSSTASVLHQALQHDRQQTQISLHQAALSQTIQQPTLISQPTIQHVPLRQVPIQKIQERYSPSYEENSSNSTKQFIINPNYSNSALITQSTPITVNSISRPYAYHSIGLVTNSDQIYGITQEQSIQLENYHKINPYPTNDALIHLSQVFNININSLVHWFKSRNSIMVNIPASYNSYCNCHTCLSGSSLPPYSK